jgi:Ring finger domain
VCRCVCVGCCWRRFGHEQLYDDPADALSDEQIRRIPTAVYSTGMPALGEGNDRCCICLENYEPGVLLRELPCSHFYHQECVDTWLRENGLCPLCKQAVYDPKEEEPENDPFSVTGNLPYHFAAQPNTNADATTTGADVRTHLLSRDSVGAGSALVYSTATPYSLNADYPGHSHRLPSSLQSSPVVASPSSPSSSSSSASVLPSVSATLNIAVTDAIRKTSPATAIPRVRRLVLEAKDDPRFGPLAAGSVGVAIGSLPTELSDGSVASENESDPGSASIGSSPPPIYYESYDSYEF